MDIVEERKEVSKLINNLLIKLNKVIKNKIYGLKNLKINEEYVTYNYFKDILNKLNLLKNNETFKNELIRKNIELYNEFIVKIRYLYFYDIFYFKNIELWINERKKLYLENEFSDINNSIDI